MRKIAFILGTLAIVACKEKDLTSKNPAPDPENTSIRTSFVYDSEAYYSDTALTNNLGQRFFIDEVVIALSDFYFQQHGDTVAYQHKPFVVASDATDNKLIELEPNGYTGFFGIRVGLDSASQADVAANGLESGSELSDYSLLRASGNGIDNVIIRGRLIDPQDPLDSTGSIALEYRLGLSVTSKLVKSLTKNFSIEPTSNLPIIMVVDLKPVLENLDMEARPLVTTDPQNLVDYNLAIEMAENLEVNLF
ncbi:MAG: hypothetical protein U5L96_21265 [Owenweeksia sp.]|nr:hypothetical protein [Owenweeksia sp.]